MPLDAFTISSNNYLGMARIFGESYLEHHPGSQVYVCLVDQLDERVPYADLPFEIIAADDLGIPEFQNLAFRCDILELNTAVKPFVFKYLRDEVGLDRVFYFDPDILVHDRLGGLEEVLASHQAVIIEDDHSGDIATGADVSIGRHLPDRTVHVRSYSKSHGPDLRIAAVGGSADVIDPMVSRRMLGPGWTSRLLQAVLVELLTDPAARAAVMRARSTYALRSLAVRTGLAGEGVGGDADGCTS